MLKMVKGKGRYHYDLSYDMSQNPKYKRAFEILKNYNYPEKHLPLSHRLTGWAD